MIIMLEGSQRYEWRQDKRSVERRWHPGEALWLAPQATMREYWDIPTRFLGVVLRPHFVRF